MGYGDLLMAAGECGRRRREAGCGRFEVRDAKGRGQWHDIWALCPDVARPGRGDGWIVNAGGCRPYIDYGSSTPKRWTFLPYQPTPARLRLPEAALARVERYRGAVVVEPNIKSKASPNKDWGFENWQRLVDLAPWLPWLQVGPAGSRRLRRVDWAETPGFADACAVLAVARAAVLPEGGLHHAAAALTTPSVVLFGGYIGPEVTGYEGQCSLTVEEPQARGWRQPHAACAAAWEEITPDRVLKELESVL